MFNKIKLQNSYLNDIKEISIIAIPAIMAQLSQMLFGIIDTIMASHYSSKTLAAVGIGNSFFIPFMVFFLGLAMAQTPFISEALGSKTHEKISKVFKAIIIFALFWSLITSLVLLNISKLLIYVGTEASMIPTILEYIDGLIWGIIPTFLYISLSSLNESLFTPKLVVITSLIGMPFNIIFNYWFMYGGYGLPEMGAYGLGLSTSFTKIILLIVLAYSSVKTHFKKYQINLFGSIDLKVLKELLIIGTPISFTMLIRIGIFSIMSLFIARYSIEANAAHQISLGLNGLLYMVTTGLGIALAAKTAFYIGKKNAQKQKDIALIGLVLGLGSQILISLLVFFLGSEVISLYTSDSEVSKLALIILSYLLIGQVLEGLNTIARSILQGHKDTKVPMLYTLLCFWLINIPLGMYFGDSLELKAKGFWIALTLVTLLSTIILTRRVLKKI